MIGHWIILSAGPSLEQAPWGDIQMHRGPVVAVGSAVFAPVSVDFWVVNDKPEMCSRAWDRLPPPGGPMVWCGDKNESLWQELGFRTWSHPGGGFTFPEQLHMKDIRGLNAGSFLTALSQVIASRAKKITIYGCDQEGAGHAFADYSSPRGAGFGGEKSKTAEIVANYPEVEIEFVRQEESVS